MVVVVDPTAPAPDSAKAGEPRYASTDEPDNYGDDGASSHSVPGASATSVPTLHCCHLGNSTPSPPTFQWAIWPSELDL